MAVLALNTSAYRNAVSRLHREVSQEMFHDLWPQLAGLGSADHLDHQRRAPAELAQRRPGRRSTISTCSRTGASASTTRRSGSRSRRFPDEELLEAHRRRKRRLVAFVRERQQLVGAAPAGLGGGGARIRRGARPQRVHHRFRAPLRHLQARHAAVPRRGAAQAHPAEQGDAGADRHRRQGASQGPAGQELTSARSCSFRAIRTCGSTWSSSKTTT